MFASGKKPVAEGDQFVSRGGTDGWDFEKADLLINDLWHDMDLSAIIPENAVAVQLRVEFRNTAANRYVTFREKGIGDEYCIYKKMTQVGDVYKHLYPMLHVDGNRKIEYKVDSGNGWSYINIVVLAWFI